MTIFGPEQLVKRMHAAPVIIGANMGIQNLVDIVRGGAFQRVMKSTNSLFGGLESTNIGRV